MKDNKRKNVIPDGEAIRCCENGRLVSPMPETCFPILIPPNDGFYGPRGQRCINFVRSMLALNENCALGPVEQVRKCRLFSSDVLFLRGSLFLLVFVLLSCVCGALVVEWLGRALNVR